MTETERDRNTERDRSGKLYFASVMECRAEGWRRAAGECGPAM